MSTSKPARPSRYELSQIQWEQIEDVLDPGRTVAGNRTFVNDVLWVLRSVARWSELRA